MRTPEKYVTTFSEWFEFPVAPLYLNPEYPAEKVCRRESVGG
jgi:hypothetical protein